jgi:hypothetical protein
MKAKVTGGKRGKGENGRKGKGETGERQQKSKHRNDNRLDSYVLNKIYEGKGRWMEKGKMGKWEKGKRGNWRETTKKQTQNP